MMRTRYRKRPPRCPPNCLRKIGFPRSVPSVLSFHCWICDGVAAVASYDRAYELLRAGVRRRERVLLSEVGVGCDWLAALSWLFLRVLLRF
jgi:hypothetical protein